MECGGGERWVVGFRSKEYLLFDVCVRGVDEDVDYDEDGEPEEVRVAHGLVVEVEVEVRLLVV